MKIKKERTNRGFFIKPDRQCHHDDSCDHAAVKQLVAIMQEALDKIKADITAGEYDY